MQRMITATTTALVALTAVAISADSPTWRGPSRTGIYPGKNLLSEWPPGGPAKLWSKDVGDGFSTVSVADGRVYVAGMTGGKGVLYCFDTQGNEKWKKTYGAEWAARSHSGTRTTPTVHDGRVYVVSTHGKVCCFDAKTGEQKWTVGMLKLFGGENIQWGIAESPLVFGDKVICTPGGKRASVVALDRKTGEVEWKTPAVRGRKGTQRSAYCSPVIIEHNNRKILVTHLSDSIVGIDPDTGKGLWTYPFRNRHAVHAVSPLYHDGLVIFSGGYGWGSLALKLSSDGTRVTKAWKNDDLATHHGGIVEVDGYIYGTNDKGLVCLNAKTGKTMWEDRAISKGSVIYAGGLLYYHTERGEFGIAKVDPKDGLKVVSSVKHRKPATRAHPVLAEGILFIRQGETLTAYDVRSDKQ
ncbi:MAG: PQQ-binding-like beta-propeller repeat protein [Phycisphaerae bacterium]